MKNIFNKVLLSVLILVAVFGLSNFRVYADSNEDRGKEIFNQLTQKQTNCSKLTEQDFEDLGDYYMGLMSGNSHEYMEQMMTYNMGADGLKSVHITMGKRLSGCDVVANFPQNYNSGTPFYSMMGPNGYSMMGGFTNGNYMMATNWSALIWIILTCVFIISLLFNFILLIYILFKRSKNNK